MATATTKNKKESFFDEIIREARYRRCIILDGNVRDSFDDGKKHYLPLPNVLLRRLAAMETDDGGRCFTICGCWDATDGLTFVDPLMQKAFQRALKHQSQTDASSEHPISKSGKEYDDRSSDTPSGKDPVNTGILKQPQEAFPAMRRVLSHPSERAVFVLGWQEYLVGDPAHQDPGERHLLTILGKAIAEQTTGQTNSDAMNGPTGLLIIITSNLNSFPESLFKDNPRTKVITVGKPDRPQRLAFLTQSQRFLRVAEPKPAPGKPICRYGSGDAILSHMADLCDDLTTIDMQNIVALSRQPASKMRPDRLVNLYKFGKQSSPWRDLDKGKLDNVFEELKKRVMGQDHALKAAEAMLQTAYVELEDPWKRRQPRGIMFYVGPTGVGKTELAKAIAEFVYGDENALISLDMSNYSQEHDVQRLVGAPPSYVGFQQGGELTNRTRQKPFCVIVFDEIEKAHRKLWDKFLQILEEGRLTDGRGQTVLFNQSIIIFTSNIGQDCQENLAAKDLAALHEHFKERVIRFFTKPISEGGLNRPELVDRVGEDNIIPFHYITDPAIRKKILQGKLTTLQETFRERFGMGFEVSDRCIDWLESRSRTGIIRRDITNVVKHYFHKNRLTTFVYRHLHQLKSGRTLFTDVANGGDDIKFEIREGSQDDNS